MSLLIMRMIQEYNNWYQDNPLSPITSREGPFEVATNVDEEIDWTEENEWSDIQDVDVTKFMEK